MKNYTEEEIKSLIERFEAEELPKVEWTHEAHLVVAIWYCSQQGFAQALQQVRTNITNHNSSVGTPNTDTEGYHESITKFWLLIAKEYLGNHPLVTMAQSCNDFINSEFAESNYPLNFYSKECLFSTRARLNWVEPDLKPIGVAV